MDAHRLLPTPEVCLALQLAGVAVAFATRCAWDRVLSIGLHVALVSLLLAVAVLASRQFALLQGCWVQSCGTVGLMLLAAFCQRHCDEHPAALLDLVAESNESAELLGATQSL